MDQVEWKYAWDLYAAQEGTRTPVSQATFQRVFADCMSARGYPSVPEGMDPAEFWNTKRLNDTAATREGDQAATACLRELSSLKPE